MKELSSSFKYSDLVRLGLPYVLFFSKNKKMNGSYEGDINLFIFEGAIKLLQIFRFGETGATIRPLFFKKQKNEWFFENIQK